MASDETAVTIVKPEDVELGEILGHGGFGTVYLATHRHWGDVAVKQFRKSIVNEIKKEATKMWRAVSSPYLVRIMGIIDTPDNLSIVMECFENGNLKDFQRYMDCDCWPRKVRMLADISLGMNYLHTLNPPILHRDLKLENIFVGNGFEAKVGDLGLAISDKTIRQQSKLSIAGTITHIAPEILAGSVKEPKEPCDIFGFAVTVYELLSGKDPWPQANTFANDALIGIWVINGQRPDKSEIPTDAPSEVIEMMERCWSSDPTKRPTFQEIQKQLNGLYKTKYRQHINDADHAIFECRRKRNTNDRSGYDVVDGAGDREDSGIGEGRQDSVVTQDMVKLEVSSDQSINVKIWQLVRQFGQRGSSDGQFQWAHGIAISHGDVIIIADPVNSRVYSFSSDGKFERAIDTPYPADVAVTSKGNILILDQTHNIGEYNQNGTLQRHISTLAVGENPTVSVDHACITVDAERKVLVGDAKHNKVIILNECSGSVLKKLDVNIRPQSLATNSNQQIVICETDPPKIAAFDYTGKELFTFNPTIADQECRPMGVLCSSNDDIYVSLSQANSKGWIAADTGHIHRYTSTGSFLECIASGLQRPVGMAFLSDGSLVIANKSSVLVFQNRQDYLSFAC